MAKKEAGPDNDKTAELTLRSAHRRWQRRRQRRTGIVKKSFRIPPSRILEELTVCEFIRSFIVVVLRLLKHTSILSVSCWRNSIKVVNAGAKWFSFDA